VSLVSKEQLKNEATYGLILLVIFIVLFKMLFYSESLLSIVRVIASLFWMSIIPGYLLMFYWRSKLNFLERIIIGSVLSMGILGTVSYYIGLLGLNVNLHYLILPLLIIACGIYLSYISLKHTPHKQEE
jgi:hypothetical protein